MDTSAETLQ